MNTRNKQNAVFLPKGLNYEFCNEDLEMAFETSELEVITDKWNSGSSIENIAVEHSRDPDEIFLAIFHQAREGKILRKYQLKNQIKHLKYKKDIPTVIEYEGRRYVYDPKNT